MHCTTRCPLIVDFRSSYVARSSLRLPALGVKMLNVNGKLLENRKRKVVILFSEHNKLKLLILKLKNKIKS